MKQIVLILLFIFTLQKKIHTDPLKDAPKDQHHKRESVYQLIFPKTKCDPGYEKKCRIIGMYIRIRNIPKRCFCYEIKSEKTRNLIEVKTTNVKTTNLKTTNDKTVKDKDKPIKDDRLKDKTNKNYHPLRRRPMIETIIKDHPKCQKGEYFVAVTYPDKGITKFGCTKDPYSYLKYY